MIAEQRFDQFERALALIIFLRDKGPMHLKEIQEALGDRGVNCHQRTVYRDMQFLARTGMVEVDWNWGGGARWRLNEEHPLVSTEPVAG